MAKPRAACYRLDIMLQDKWGLPRRWLFWRDGVFWLLVALNGITVIEVFAIAGINAWPFHQPLSLVLWSALLTVWVVEFWAAYDSYRWDTPSRWVYLGLIILFWPFGVATYLMKRPEWMDQIQYRRGKPI